MTIYKLYSIIGIDFYFFQMITIIFNVNYIADVDEYILKIKFKYPFLGP